jgi:hypothetical protein
LGDGFHDDAFGQEGDTKRGMERRWILNERAVGHAGKVGEIIRAAEIS